MMYDFVLFYDKCNEKFSSFDDFAEACEEFDAECAVDWDNEDVTFYDFSFDFDWRKGFILDTLNKKESFDSMATRQIEVQRAFRQNMAMWF